MAWLKEADLDKKVTGKKIEDAFDELMNSDLETFVKVVYDGDMNYFLEDNPGAQEAVMEWVSGFWQVKNLAEDQVQSLLDWHKEEFGEEEEEAEE